MSSVLLHFTSQSAIELVVCEASRLLYHGQGSLTSTVLETLGMDRR